MEAQKKFEGKHSDLTGKILGAFFQLHKEIGYGFSEKVYETAFGILLVELGMVVDRQKDICVYYHGKVVGEYAADMIVNSIVLLELKSVAKLTDVHDAQLLNYLKPQKLKLVFYLISVLKLNSAEKSTITLVKVPSPGRRFRKFNLFP